MPSNGAASSATTIDVDFLHYLVLSSVNNGEGGVVY